MKIQYCSDLHLEMSRNLGFISKNPIKVFGDILLIAGDLVPTAKKDIPQIREEIIKLCKPFQKVFWVPGNHEYYYGTYRRFFEKSDCVNPFPQIENLFKVDNYTETIGKIRFIFSTLWSHILPDDVIDVKYSMNDFKLISVIDPKNEETRHFRVGDFINYHEIGFNYIQKQVKLAVSEKESGDIEKIIVVTHHVPTMQNLPKERIGSSLNSAYATNLDSFIENSGIDYWIHGHMHFNHGGFNIGDTRILCNQVGYVNDKQHHDFDWNNFIDTKK